MRKYRVNVNGTMYEIEIEEINGSSSMAARQTAPVRTAVPVKAPVPAAPPKTPEASRTPASSSAEGTAVCAPLPGNIVEVRVSGGQAVKKGDVLVILEAMKMENEIMAPCDGTVTSVSISAGAAVNSGALLCSIQ